MVKWLAFCKTLCLDRQSHKLINLRNCLIWFISRGALTSNLDNRHIRIFDFPAIYLKIDSSIWDAREPREGKRGGRPPLMSCSLIFYCHAAQSQVNMHNRRYLVERKSRETNAQRATSRFALFAQLLQAKSRCRKSFNVTRGFPQEWQWC